ncbi:MAG: hypothetical protein C5B49_11855 [Bdellovibrio sp.]|nr:MAG: hypothetical protein C5B49_11855 [Bdellovibrio sp.]
MHVAPAPPTLKAPTWAAPPTLGGGISMKFAIKRWGDVTVISIEGILNIEQTQPFRQYCLDRFMSEKVVFNMKAASFVGSTGLQSFLDTIKNLDRGNSFGIKMVGVKPEFRRLLTHVETERISFFEEESLALSSFTVSEDPATRSQD